MADGFLDESGWLVLNKAGHEKKQFCPYDNGEEGARCGDWCPLLSVLIPTEKPEVLAIEHGCSVGRVEYIVEDSRKPNDLQT